MPVAEKKIEQMTIHIVVNPKSDKPMYKQIEEAIKTAILEGELKQHEQLPSAKLLAASLGVSQITTKRAYLDLKHEGFVYSFSGKGTFCMTPSVPRGTLKL